MNQLPEHRRVINGRTFDRTWRAADYDPIERPALLARTARQAETIMVVLAVCAIFAMLKGLL